MLVQIYRCIGILTHFIVSVLLMRYIFLIPPLRRPWMRALYHGIACVACLAGGFFLSVPVSLMMLGGSVVLYLLLTGHGKMRFLSVLQTIPILGINYGLIMTPKQLPVVMLNLNDTTNQIFSIILYGLVDLAFVVFLFAGQSWRNTFNQDSRYRHLENWERILLYVIGGLMFLFAATFSNYTNVTETSYRFAVMQSVFISSVIGFVMTITIIILILQGNKKIHFQEEVLKMQHNIIVTMADIVENRDENTGGHIKRTATYVQIIAMMLKAENLYTSILTDQYITDMYIAAPLHDIGKIHIPDSVLKKEGRLTDEEYEIMKSHTTAGKALLEQAEKNLGKSSYLEIAKQMACYHHEWWNGRGYPEGIRGQDIPLCARIMAVADVFDAIVSQRCYKGAMQMDEAYAQIRKESGTHFDPVVVDAFVEAKEQITEVCRMFGDHPDGAEPSKPAGNPQKEAVQA